MEGKWFQIWLDDKLSIIDTMVHNMQADLAAGYNPESFSIRKQRVDIEEYRMKLDREMDSFKHMEDRKINMWCYYDLKRRGAIA